MAQVREETPMNLLVQAILAKLEGISERKDAAYLTTPRKVSRLHMIGDFAQVPKPVLAVAVAGWDATPAGAQRFDGKLSIAVDCMVSLKGDPEGELLRLVSDVILALTRDVTVGGQAVYLFPQSFEPNVDRMKATGLAVTTVLFECGYKFDASNP